MTQEEKSLLLKDLCARLPYGVIVKHADPLVDNDGNETDEFWYKRGYLCNINTLDDMTTTIIESEGSDAEGYEHICFLERTVPYLRPMSSMTEEEKEEIKPLFSKFTDEFGKRVLVVRQNKMALYQDWLNKHHFDYRDLIECGLAIAVTGDNNPYKE